MYYPYLRARQFELIAVRELVTENVLQDYVIPVLEPVKESFNNLRLAHAVLTEGNFNCYLIMNPLVGEIPGDTNTFLDFKNDLVNSRFLSAFHYTNNSQYILDSIAQYNLTNCLIICYQNYTDNSDLRELLANPSITHIMVFEPLDNRSLNKFIKTLDKTYIRLDDVFEKQLKNADFLNIAAHKLTEAHLYYKEDGFQGFSDFTMLPSEYIDGGSTPRAVVIHLTYINADSENQIWIRHFTSNTNDSIANVQGKFAEAAEKAIIFCNATGLANSAITELREYYDETRYPGLGTVKKVSIKNHLHIVTNFLN